MEFRDVFVLIWCLCLPVMSASLFCSNDSQVDTQEKAEGNIVFPLTSLVYPPLTCIAAIRSPFDSKTRLTLVNLRRNRPMEECYENYVEIFNRVNGSLSWYKFCKSVGSTETLTLRSTIRMTYKPSFRNEIGVNGGQNSIYIHYKRIDSTKTCRHLLTAQNGVFKTSGYPNYPLQGECEWVISNENGGGILLEFQILNDRYLNCDDNYIEVRKSNKSTSGVKICSQTQPRAMKFSASKLWIKIKSTGIGFRATYKTWTCQVIAANKQLDFQSPNTRTFCKSWNLTAPPGQIVALSFSHVNLVSTDSSSCSGNVLEVWDGETRTLYCSFKHPPSIITSKGRKLVVTFRSNEFDEQLMDLPVNSFKASFTSISPSSFKANCFVQHGELSFKCNNQRIIPCAWQCDGAMQCSDNSDENICSNIKERWQKLQVFVIVMGSICASTVLFCVGLVCFRKFVIRDGSPSSERRRRNLSTTDQSPLSPNADLPSPPPCYFTNRDEEQPATVTRGTYFFGDEFSQSGIHSASLFGIPPPRYRSTESLHPSNTDSRSIWQRGISTIPLVPTNEIVSLPEEGPPDYDSVPADKDEQIVTSTTTQNNDVPNDLEAHVPEMLANAASFSNEHIADPNNLDNEMSNIELQTHVPVTSTHLASLSNESNAQSCNLDMDIGITNHGAILNV